jgi:metallo-beta-lactamase class B
MFVIAALLPLTLLAQAPPPSPSATPPAAPAAPSPLSEDPFPPHRIADNLYYVGSQGLASYLVTTRKGHILINPDFESTVPLLRSNVEKLGFKFTDIEILLNSHAHDDHVGGMALAKQLSGADVYVMKGDDQTIATGGAGQTARPWKPTPVKRVLADGDKVSLGGTTLTAVLTPGHTRGCTTWTMKVKDGDRTRDVVIVCSPNVNPNYRLVDDRAAGRAPPPNAYTYPDIVKDYEKSFRTWKALPCDIFLGAHGNYYDLPRKHQRLLAGDRDAFVDPTGYRAYIEERERTFRTKLAEQQKQLATITATQPPK